MKQDNIDLSRLLDLIERYYDCSLSDDEERRLRRTVAETTLSHPAIDEVRALMGFRLPATAAKGENARRTKRFPLRPAISIAAAVALLITLGVNFIRPASVADDIEATCIAYVNGACITDEDDIIRLIADDMREFDDSSDEAAESFRSELDDFATIVDSYESEIIFPEI